MGGHAARRRGAMRRGVHLPGRPAGGGSGGVRRGRAAARRPSRHGLFRPLHQLPGADAADPRRDGGAGRAGLRRAGLRRAEGRADRQARHLGGRRQGHLREAQAGAGRDRRPGRLHRPARLGHRGKAWGQPGRVSPSDRAGGGIQPGRERSEERSVGEECRYWRDWSSDVCSSDLKGAQTGKLASWVGGDRAAYEKHKRVLDAIGDQAAYIGPIGSGTVAKLVHNLSGYAIQTVRAEVFSMGVKAGMDPLELWKAIRQGSLGRRRTFDRVADQFLVDKYEPPAFALKLAHKDVTLAVGLGREVGVPMRLCNLVMEEMTEGLNRGWAALDSRIPMKLQLERAGVAIQCDLAAVQAVLDGDKA